MKMGRPAIGMAGACEHRSCESARNGAPGNTKKVLLLPPNILHCIIEPRYHRVVGDATKGEFMDSIPDNERKGDGLPQRTYRVCEIAKILGISNASAYRLIKEGHFNTVRIGTSIRISRQSFDDWLDKVQS